MREAGPGGDPLDLLDTGTARQLAAGPAASQQARAADRPSFARQGGKLVVREDRDVIKDTADPAGWLPCPTLPLQTCVGGRAGCACSFALGPCCDTQHLPIFIFFWSGGCPLGVVTVSCMVPALLLLLLLPSDRLVPAGRLAKGGRPGEADSDLEDEFDDLRIGGKRKRAAAGAAPGTALPAAESRDLSDLFQSPASSTRLACTVLCLLLCLRWSSMRRGPNCPACFLRHVELYAPRHQA